MNNNGFSALVLVLIIGISSLIMATTSTWLGLRDLEISQNSLASKKANYVAEACLEEALFKYQQDPDYSSASTTISLADCSCNYSSNSLAGQKNIFAKANCDNHYVDLKATITISEGININYWAY